MHILFFYQYYHTPDCASTGRHYTFLNHLARRHKITLLTTNAWLHKRITSVFDWVPEGIQLIEFDIPYDNSMDISQRLKAFGTYAIQAIRSGIRITDADVVFATSTPLSTAWAGAQVARKLNLPFVFEVRDLWPDFPIQMGAIPFSPIQKFLYRIEEKLYHQAQHIITLSPDMSTHVQTKGIPSSQITTLVNGTDFDLLQTYASHPETLKEEYPILKDKFVVLYAGAFGRANAIPTLRQTMHLLRNAPDIFFVVSGDGYHRPMLEEAAQLLPNVLLLPPLPRHQMLRWFKLANLSLVLFKDLPVLATNSPAKFFDSLGAGTPVIVTNPGWTRQFVELHQCGWYSPPEHPEALAHQIQWLANQPTLTHQAGQRGETIARALFDRQLMAYQLEQILEHAVATPQTLPSMLPLGKATPISESL